MFINNTFNVGVSNPVYGLGADALNGEAVKKIFLAKGRPQDNPLIIHVSSKKIEKFVKDVPPVAEKLMDKFWPGPMTIILNKKDIVPDETSAGPVSYTHLTLPTT